MESDLTYYSFNSKAWLKIQALSSAAEAKAFGMMASMEDDIKYIKMFAAMAGFHFALAMKLYETAEEK